ncbi:hypothetical protein [Pseudomonas quasicaspiana]|uniref:hypothetical protein n=1 Tax=Pseudomonas quasicaspiana TaxID=2829821 RepID=UPI001E65A35E|nr:hypothetical protein [Pseudomonas quasicaspiana]MCD5973497.1 hypothetical protein [Pseudomonas quasicaspiana]
MTDDTQEVKSIILCEEYQSIVNSIKKATNIKIHEDYNDILASMDSKRFALSGLSHDEVMESLKDKPSLLTYSINKFKNIQKDTEQDGHEPSTLIKSHGYAQGFLLANLMEFEIAKRGRKELEQYLKASRIPDWKNYAKEVLSFMP